MFKFTIFIFFTLILFIQPSYSDFLSNNPNFDPDIDLFGDAKILADHSGNGTHIKLTDKSSLTAGLLLRRQPITFSNLTSFSVEFTFSISGDVGDGLLFILIPHDLAAAFPGNGSYGLDPSSPMNSYLGVEFDTSKDDNVNDVNANHVGIDVGSLVSVAVANVSASNLVLNNGEKLKSWVDYDVGSQLLEVRLSKLNEPKSENPIVSHNLDLFKIWGDQSVFMGLSSSNDANSVQVVRVYSWKVILKNVTVTVSNSSNDANSNKDEQQQQQQQQEEVIKVDAAEEAAKKKDRSLTLLAGVIFGTVCVVLVTFVILFMWVIFFHKHEEESLAKLPENPSDVRYERIDVAVDKNAEDHDEQQH
ncbi:L-type lectin-domain containing receptor kinase VIII.2-like [Trifolium pratense]|uniref:L-type lectin-domain containing receptor kinase VIII.2-like n=1 Tax=Trifolium pratense TaxID=57577 RepID=UPI001E694AD8|nr:L-type lectin-domain containing receptor kinase VIII.2-like [Trifolium pratense]